jgi:hypothetical protein
VHFAFFDTLKNDINSNEMRRHTNRAEAEVKAGGRSW